MNIPACTQMLTGSPAPPTAALKTPLDLQGAPQKEARISAGMFIVFQESQLKNLFRMQNSDGMLQKALYEFYIPGKPGKATF